MSKKGSDSSRSVEPPETDDLKLINGIGPAVERRLQGVGIYTYAQLAALPPADIAASVTGLSGLTAERIIKQDWIGQARRLAVGLIPTESRKQVEVAADSLLSEPETTIPVSEEAGPAPPVLSEVEPIASTAEEARSTPLSLSETESAAPVGASPIAEQAEIGSPVVAIFRPVGVLRLREMEVVAADAHGPRNVLSLGQPFYVRLTLDLTAITMPGDTQLSYKASIYGKSLGEHRRQIVGDASGIITSTDKVTVSIEGTALPKGTYRLKAVVILNPVTTEFTPQTSLVASKECDLLLIFTGI